ncbi:cation diffusion facilitator family transporter [Tepidiforma flava]|uniref:Cation diffusion facilitator family transporter n=1 Tax=Tepidiforma flava TaxID=3004094 RepID=A0ABY7M5E6_9CHLR|nr:cation diffusion facilitator family transporter [Tepidiforma flava]WBL35314.1 cation diffusion facilitator family transporter [Tepidiforma flava]
MAHPPVHRRELLLGLGLTLAFAAAQAAVGLAFGSIALVSDAGHMLTDAVGLGLAFLAATIAARPPDARRTFGYARAEVLAVPLHVALLAGIAAFIVYESLGRLDGSHTIRTGPVLVTAALGLGVNLLVLRILHGHSHDNLNIRGAVLEAMADALGSVLVIVSAAAIALGASPALDPIAALLIAALILPRAVNLLRQAGAILLESAPPGLDPRAIAAAARDVQGVLDLHDVHVWSIAPSFPALSAHVELADAGCTEHVLTDLAALFRERFGIVHVTLQPETPALHLAIACCSSPDAALLDAGHAHEPARS